MPCVLVRGCARRTNLYAAGAREPLLVSCPLHAGSHGAAVTSPVSLLDITPTILDWLQLPLPSYSIFRSAVIGQQKRTLILVIGGV